MRCSIADFPNKNDRKAKYNTARDAGCHASEARRLRDLGWGALARWIGAYAEVAQTPEYIARKPKIGRPPKAPITTD